MLSQCHKYVNGRREEEEEGEQKRREKEREGKLREGERGREIEMQF